MNARETDHPFDLEVLAALAEGTLDREALPGVIAHVSRCKTCRDVVAGAAGLEDTDRDHGWWKYAVAAAILLAIIGGILLASRRVGVRSDPIAVMASAAPVRARSVEPRLSGFRWAPYRNVMASSPHQSGEELVARGVAGKVLHDLQGDNSARGLHAKGVAFLLRDKASTAVELLRLSARLTPEDPRIWNDLAAALYIHGQDEAELREALAAARRAILLDPRLAEAYFNAALIRERIGTNAEIRASWSEYLRHDSTSEWAEEAKNRLASYLDGS